MNDEEKIKKEEQKRIEDELRNSEARYRTLFDNSPASITLVDMNGVIIDCNNATEKLIGYSKEEIMGKPFEKLLTSKQVDMPKLRERFSMLSKGETGTPYELEIIKKDGQKRWIMALNSLLFKDYDIVGIQVISEDITEQKKAEDGIRESEERFRSAFDFASIGRAMANPTGKFIDVNTSFCQILGYKGEELLQKTWMEITYPDDLKESAEHVRQLMGGEKSSIRYIHRLIHKDGHIVWVDLNVILIRNTEGEPLYMVGDIVDITDHKQAEEALQESEEKFRYLVENSNEVIYSVDDKGIVTYISPRIQSLLGYTPDELIGQDFTKFMYIEDLEQSKKRLLENLSQANPPSEYRVLSKSGEIRWVYTSSKPIVKGEQIIGVQGVLSDITERKKAEEAVRLERDKAQKYLDLAGVMFVAINSEGEVNLINKKGCDILGYNEDKIIGKNWFENFLPEGRKEEVTQVFKRLMKEDIELIEYYENPILTKLGEQRLIAWHNTLLRNEDGNITGTLSSGEDITDRKKAEKALQASEQKHRILYETMTQGVVYQDVEGNIISANSAAEQILGLTVDQMMGRTSMDPRWKSIKENGSDFPGDTHPSMIALKTGEEVRNVVMGIYHPDKERHVWININAVPQFKQGEDKPYQVYTTFEDITHRIETEEHIKASLHEKELLLKEIHHRVKNNLQVISSMLSLQSMHIMDDDLKAMFRESQGRVQTMAIVHEKMYQSPDLSKIGFADYLTDLTNELFTSYGVDSSQITSEVNVADIKLGVDVAIPCGLIVNELISNSLKHAFPNGEKGEIKVDLIRDNEDKFNLVVGDNGVGFPKGIDFKQMESLGLRLVNTLVDQLKGTIELENKGGTKFKIEFKVPGKLKGLRE